MAVQKDILSFIDTRTPRLNVKREDGALVFAARDLISWLSTANLIL